MAAGWEGSEQVGDIVGYARVSTGDQDLAGQRMRLEAAGAVHVFGWIARFERRLIAERTKDGSAAARVRRRKPGRQPVVPDKVGAALKLVQAGLSPTTAARQVGLGRATIHREMALADVRRAA